MRFPQHPGKHARPALFTPQHFFDYLERTGARRPVAPPQVLLVYMGRLVTRAAARWGARTPARPPVGVREFAVVGRGARAVGLAEVRGVGGPALSVTVEELAAAGTRRFVSVGYAGSLDPALRAGAAVLCTAAIRDEGTSYHYVRPARWAYPTRALDRELFPRLSRAGIPVVRRRSWTIDAPYRETVGELRSVRRLGAATVEMEASALFAMARALGVEAAALFTVSDLLDERGWRPRFDDAFGPLETLLDGARDALRALPAPGPRARRARTRRRTRAGGKVQ